MFRLIIRFFTSFLKSLASSKPSNIKTNLFSLWQDSNTCVVPFGSAVTSPSPLSGFGASTSNGYIPGEYSFIGYNTNFESLFTNFNSTYYSDQEDADDRKCNNI